MDLGQLPGSLRLTKRITVLISAVQLRVSVPRPHVPVRESHRPAEGQSRKRLEVVANARDLCGGDPLCVQVCLSGALRYEEDSESSAVLRNRYAEKMFAEEETVPAELTDAQWQEICRRIDEAAGTGTTVSVLKAHRERLRTAAEEEGAL